MPKGNVIMQKTEIKLNQLKILQISSTLSSLDWSDPSWTISTTFFSLNKDEAILQNYFINA